MYQILLTIHLIVALLLITVVLLQQGKGAQAGAAFGSGASQTVFGSQGSGGFLSRTTAILATLFFVLSIALAYMVNKKSMPSRAVAPTQSEQGPEVPSAPGGGDIPQL